MKTKKYTFTLLSNDLQIYSIQLNAIHLSNNGPNAFNQFEELKYYCLIKQMTLCTRNSIST